MRKKIGLFALCVGLIAQTLVLSSCSFKEVIGVTDVGGALETRIELNKKILHRYYTAGLVSETTYKNTNKSLDKKHEAFEELTNSDDLNANGEKTLETLVGSTTWVNPYVGSFSKGTTSWKVSIADKNWSVTRNGESSSYGNIDSEAVNELSNRKAMLSKYLQYHYLHGDGYFDDMYENSSKDYAFELIDSALANELNKVLSFEVYVLDPKKFSESKGGGSIDELVTQLEMIKTSTKVETSVTTTTDASGNTTSTGTSADATDYWNKVLAEYFVDSGLTLNDMTKKENLAVVDSVNAGVNYGVTESDCGKDLTVRCGTDKWDMLSLRLKEFNGSVYEQLCNNGLLDDTNWLLVKDGTNGGKLYCMNYPVSVIKTITEVDDQNIAVSEFDITDMYLNIYTGKTSKNGEYWGGNDTDFTLIENKADEYLNLDKSNNSDLEKSVSSYMIMGSNEIENVGYDEQGVKQPAETARIILRDYLEATYMPDVVGKDKVVLYGRKIRFIRIPTIEKPMAKNLQIAKFVDSDGKDIEGSYEIFCDSFADIDKLSAASAEVNYIKRNVDKNKDGQKAPKVSENLQDALGQLTYLSFKDVKEIKLASKQSSFPGNAVNKPDKGNNKLPLFYYVALNSEMADNGLMDWVNAENDVYGYSWWSKWLDTNGYNYALAGNSIKSLFEGNYRYGSATSGVASLDLSVIAKLQDYVEEEEDQRKANILVTAFILLGWTLVIFGVLLPLLWLLDTSFDMGVKFIETISFGHWIAVKDPMELPEINTEGKAFLTFGKLLMKSLLVVFIGIVLIRINIWHLVITLVQSFGIFADKIYELLAGSVTKQ